MEFLIPSRTNRPGDDPIFTLSAEANARAAKGEAIVNASIGVLLDDEGRLAVLGGVAEALHDMPAEITAGYAPIEGNAEFLRAVVADVLGSRPAAGWAAAVATPGGSGAIRIAYADFLEPQQTALTTSYYWAPYRTFADEMDRGLETFRMFDERGRLDTVDLERKLRATVASQGRGLLLLNSPCHNPTGYSFDEEEWRRVADIVERVGEEGAGSARGAGRAPITLVLDVAYSHYSAAGLDGCLDQVLRLAGKAMILIAWSGSKAFTQYGSRVGALLAIHPDAEQRRRVQNALTYSCRGTWSNCNAAGMAAVARALTDPSLRARTEKERGAMKALLDRRVARWNELASAKKLKYPRYDGGFFITVFCDDAPAASTRLKEEGVFVVPISGGLRVALSSVAERDIPRLIDAIARQASP